jgi:hypothetical protein
MGSSAPSNFRFLKVLKPQTSMSLNFLVLNV